MFSSWTVIQIRCWKQFAVLSSGCRFHILRCKLILVSYQTLAVLSNTIVNVSTGFSNFAVLCGELLGPPCILESRESDTAWIFGCLRPRLDAFHTVTGPCSFLLCSHFLKSWSRVSYCLRVSFSISKGEEVMGEWKIHNEERCYLYFSPNISRVIKSRRITCAVPVACAEK
jgi:hypothetical protein